MDGNWKDLNFALLNYSLSAVSIVYVKVVLDA